MTSQEHKYNVWIGLCTSVTYFHTYTARMHQGIDCLRPFHSQQRWGSPGLPWRYRSSYRRYHSRSYERGENAGTCIEIC